MGECEMQIASFILVNDRLLHQFESQLEMAFKEVSSPHLIFMNFVSMRLQELGSEHPISIPFGSFLPLDQAAERQHERILSAFEDPHRPSKLGQIARTVNAPIYYVSPGRVRDFARELEDLRLAQQIYPEDVESLLGKKISTAEIPTITLLVEQFRHDLYSVYRDAAIQGKGVVVLVVNQPDAMNSDESFPRAA